MVEAEILLIERLHDNQKEQRMIEVIGEIGVNHNGSLQTACKLANAAKEAGCDVVKTQLWNTERVYPKGRWAEMKALELDRDKIFALKEHCDSIGIEFLCTPDEIEDAQFLRDIGVKRIKTSSQDITNLPFLREVARMGLPMIVSTGACTRDEMDRAMLICEAAGQVTPLHCVSAYPASVAGMNLRVIEYMKKTYYLPVGLSDHTIGNEAAVLALACGATVFEKHLTLDKMQDGPDHVCSATPQEMSNYIAALKRADVILGDGVKRIMPSEAENRKRYDAFIAPRKERT
jgi:N,N'-diacetyllegionaminate synthase